MFVALFVAVIGLILPKQRKGKKEVTNWQAALSFILINLAENQSYFCVIIVA